MDRRFRITKWHAVVALGGTAAAMAAAPALAASGMTLQNVQAAFADFTLREWLLSASLLLLVVALAARLMRNRVPGADRRVVVEDAPDLRWWRNPLPEPAP